MKAVKAVAFPLAGERVESLLSEAVHVRAVEIYVDPDTMDRILIVHSDEFEPIPLRVGPDQLPRILKDLADRIAASMN